MKIQVNQRVKFLNEKGGGIVTKIDKNIAIVRTEDGFEIPYPIDELIVDKNIEGDEFFKAQESQEQSKAPKVEEYKPIKKENEEVNIFIATTVDNLNNPQKINFHLVNDSNWNLLYALQIRFHKDFVSYVGNAMANYIEEIIQIDASDANKIKELVLQLIFYRSEPYSIKEPFIKKIECYPLRFTNAKNYVISDFFEEKVHLITILEENPMVKAIEEISNEQIIKVSDHKEKSSKEKPKKFRSPFKPDTIEVDLHIDKLVDDTTGMDAKTILDLQMKKFEVELLAAKKKQYVKKIIFIHGKGNGRLKFEIRNYLEKNGYVFQDASFQKYGFGATMVFLKN